MVDNAGVTKNLSVLYKEYADSVGTTVGALTKEQEILAEVNGIQREARFQMGDAAKLAGTYSGQLSALSVSILNLKVAFGNVLIPIIQKFLPIIKSAIDALTIFFNRLALIVGILVGVDIGAARQSMEDVQGATEGAAAAQGDLADNTKEAGKAAKGALGSFDKLNVLAKDAGAGAGAGAGADAGAGAGIGIDLGELETVGIDDGLSELTEKVSEWKKGFLDFIEPVRTAFETSLLPVIVKIGGRVWDGLLWVWENVLKPFGAWLVAELYPAIIEFLAPAIELMMTVFDALQPVLAAVWEVMKPIAAWLGDVLVAVIEWLTERLIDLNEWIKNNEETFRVLLIVVGVAVALFSLLAVPILGVIVIIAALIAIVLLLGANWDWITEKAGQAWEAIKDAWKSAGEWFRTYVTDPIKNAFSSAFEDVKRVVKSIMNSIIDIMNNMVSGVINGINGVIRAANTVGRIVGGFSPISELPTPQIPRLATGAVIPPNAEFAAILGDQRSGKNIEAPENLIRQIVREEAGNSGGGDITIKFEGSLAELARILKPAIDKEGVRVGGSLQSGGINA